MKTFQIARRVALSSAFLGVLLVLAGVWTRPAFADTCTSNGTGDWSAPGTWSCSHAPTAADNVVISSGHTVTIPELAGNQEVTDITIAGTLAANSSVLYIRGNWNGTGAFTANGGTVEFNGSAAQQIMNARTGSGKRFANVTVSGSGGLTTQFGIEMTGSLAVESSSGGLNAQSSWSFEGNNAMSLDCDAACNFASGLEVRTVDASGSSNSIVVQSNLSRFEFHVKGVAAAVI